MRHPNQGDAGRVILDLNSPEFLDTFLRLEREGLAQVVAALRRIRGMPWSEVYRSKGLNWEKIHHLSSEGGAVYSLRLSQKARAIAVREGAFLRLLSLHPDHDSAYKP